MPDEAGVLLGAELDDLGEGGGRMFQRHRAAASSKLGGPVFARAFDEDIEDAGAEVLTGDGADLGFERDLELGSKPMHGAEKVEEAAGGDEGIGGDGSLTRGLEEKFDFAEAETIAVGQLAGGDRNAVAERGGRRGEPERIDRAMEDGVVGGDSGGIESEVA